MLKHICAALLLLLSFTPLSGQAETLHVGYDATFPPFTYRDEMGKAAGLHVEITRGVLRQAGYDYEFFGYPWKRVVSLADTAEADVLLPFRHKPERFERYHMIGPFTETGSRTFLFARKDNAIHWETLDDLRGYNIGRIDGFAYPAEIEQAKGLRFLNYNGPTVNLAKMVLNHRIDLIVSDETVFWASAREIGKPEAFRPVGKAFENVFRYFVVPKEKSDLAEKLAAALKDFQKTQEYHAILRRYNLEP